MDLLRLKTLKDAKTAFLVPKKHDEHHYTVSFIKEFPGKATFVKSRTLYCMKVSDMK